MYRLSLMFGSLALFLANLSLAREWSDSSGKFKIDAELADVSDTTVRLRKASGEVVAVPLIRLSSPDQDYVKQALARSSAATAVLKKHCYTCHGEGGSDEGGMNYVLSGTRLLEKEKIVAGQPDKSLLLKRIASGKMPPDDIDVRPTKDEIETLRVWIAEGGFSPSGESAREFITTDKVLEAIAADLGAASERNRVYFRYFGITHLYNAGLGKDELQTVRLALAKLLNSLSWDRKILLPVPVDPAQTVFRIDVRDLRWTKELWEVLSLAYPYNIQYSGKTALECYQLSGTRTPLLRADWFVAQASSGPLYHALLQLPDSIDGLQRQLKVSFAQNLRQDRALRAGFTSSGVSVNPRVIERHETSDGSCWVSYDFAASAGPRNFFNNPLSFEFDGSEIMFNLPNGLQAYMVVDRAGARMDKAPTKIVRDLKSDDAMVVNGISCMRCHAAGVIPKQDEVRKHAEANPKVFGADRLKTIQALYADSETLDKQLKEDQERFRDALAKIGITRLSADGEPIFNMARRFREPIDLRMASAEIGKTPEEFRAALDKLVSLQKQVGALRVAGATVPRDVFEEAFGALVGPLGAGRFQPPGARIITAGAPPPATDTAGEEAPSSSAPAEEPSATPSASPTSAGDVRQGLVHQWKFDESKGDVARDSQGKINIALGNWDSEDVRWVKAKIGNGLQFSRPEQIGMMARDIDYPQLTITFWLNVQQETKRNPRIVHPWVALNYDYENGFGVGLFYQVMEPTKPSPGEWYHYALAIDQVKRKAVIYKNGVEIASGKITKNRDPGPWVIGHNGEPRNEGDSLNGILDDLRVYNRLLKPEEAEKLAAYGVKSEASDTEVNSGEPKATSNEEKSSAAPGDLRLGLVHYWKFDETKGDIARDALGKNNVSLANWEEEDARWVKGKFGNALQFSRDEQFGMTAKEVDYPQFTLSFWMLRQLDGGTNPRLVAPWAILDREHKRGIGTHEKVIEPTSPASGQWYHYALVIDQVKQKTIIYRNGVEVASGKHHAEPRARWVFGHREDPSIHSDSFNGLLDEVRVYKRLLTADEVATLARAETEEK